MDLIWLWTGVWYGLVFGTDWCTDWCTGWCTGRVRYATKMFLEQSGNV